MNNLIRDIFQNQNTFVECYTLTGDKRWSYIKVKKTDFINIEDSGITNNLDDLKEKLSNSTSINLVVNTDKVLSKKIESIQDTKTVFKSIFPSLSENDFYYEFISFKKFHYISIIRKKELELLVEKLTEKGINIISLSLGNGVIAELLEHLSSDDVETTNATIHFFQEDIEIKNNPFSQSNTTYQLNGIRFRSEQVLSFCLAIKTLLSQNIYFDNYTKAFGFKNNLSSISKKTLPVLLYILFGLLLVNFIFFSYFYSKVEALQSQNIIDGAQRAKIEKLQKEIIEQNKLIQLSNTKDKYITPFIDRLAYTLPQTVQLEKLSFQPVLKKIKQGESIQIDLKSIELLGTSQSETEFTDWIAHLEQQKEVDDITIVSYNQKQTQSTFTLKIHLQND